MTSGEEEPTEGLTDGEQAEGGSGPEDGGQGQGQLDLVQAHDSLQFMFHDSELTDLFLDGGASYYTLIRVLTLSLCLCFLWLYQAGYVPHNTS